MLNAFYGLELTGDGVTELGKKDPSWSGIPMPGPGSPLSMTGPGLFPDESLLLTMLPSGSRTKIWTRSLTGNPERLLKKGGTPVPPFFIVFL